MTTTTQLRDWWGPPCQGPFSRVALYGAGVVSVRPAIVDAVHALSACLERWSYETRAIDTGAYNCRKITGGTGYSLHAYGTAIDINWQANPYGPRLITDMSPAMVSAIKAIRTGNGKQVWRWGGDYAGNKDAMHFEIVCHPADLSTGIDPTTISDAQPTPTPPPQEDDMYSDMDRKRDENMEKVGQNTEKAVQNTETRIAALAELIGKVATGDLTAEQIRAAVADVLRKGVDG